MMRARSVLIGLGTSSALLLLACGNGPPPDQYSGSSTATGGGGGGPLQPVNGQTAASKVQQTDQLKFAPASVTAKVGDVIEWDNTSSVAHNVTFDQGTASSTMNPADTYQVKLTAAGSYHYKCTFHPGMEGTVTVS